MQDATIATLMEGMEKVIQSKIAEGVRSAERTRVVPKDLLVNNSVARIHVHVCYVFLY